MQDTTSTALRPFDRNDWACFSGVETANPMIAFHDGYAVILDGPVLSLFDDESEYRVTLPTVRVAMVTATAFLAELTSIDDDTLAAANLAEAFGFQAL